MPSDRTVTVAVGTIKWEYYTAASLTNCTVTRSDGRWSLVGSVGSVNAVWLSRQPLAFVVTHQHGRWTWPILEQPQIAEGVLRVRLGPPEVPDGYDRQAESRQAVTQ